MARTLYTGQTTPSASVTVYWAGTTVKPSIYVSAAGTTASNPITAAAFDGRYSFWIDDGHYTIVNGTTAGNTDLYVSEAGLPSPNATDINIWKAYGVSAESLQAWLEAFAINPSFTGTALSGGMLAITATAPATAAGSVRAVVGACNPAAGAYSSGTLVGVRGSVTLVTGNVMTGCYMYGVQGKFIGGAGTIVAGSDHVAGVLAQMDLAGTTVTSGHVAPLVVSGQTLPASADVNMIYVESGGNKVNSVLQSNVACDFFLDVNNFENCGIVATPAGATPSGDLRTLLIQIDGATYKILAAAVYS